MYGTEFDAKVVSVDGNKFILDRTLFYPTSGGQPNDTGTVNQDGTTYNVIDVYKEGDDIIHVLDPNSSLTPGAHVHGKIDWDRRYIHMRYHTAVHIIDGVVNNNYSDEGLITGGQIYEDHARVDFDFKEIDREKISKIIDEANDIVNKGLKVFQRDISRDEALNIPGLARTEPGRELIKKLDHVRIIEIENFDFQADGGTHVKNTREVGKIIMGKIENKGKGHKRLNFSLE